MATGLHAFGLHILIVIFNRIEFFFTPMSPRNAEDPHLLWDKSEACIHSVYQSCGVSKICKWIKI